MRCFTGGLGYSDYVLTWVAHYNGGPYFVANFQLRWPWQVSHWMGKN